MTFFFRTAAVIDTLKVALSSAGFKDSPLPMLWSERRMDSPSGSTRRALTHLPSGLRIFGDLAVPWSAESSLARLLHGHNGRLLKSQAELEFALTKLLGTLAEVVIEPAVAAFTRVDLCWQFPGDPAHFIAAHRTFAYPGIRALPALWPDETLLWRGSELTVRLYDKLKELTCRRGKVVRLEFSLRARLLCREFTGKLGPVREVDFDNCYQTYRRLALRLQPSIVARPKRMAELLALGELEGWQSGGVSFFDLWAATKTRRAAQGMRKAIASARVDTFAINWREILPVEAPPAALECEPRRKNARNHPEETEPAKPPSCEHTLQPQQVG